MKDSTDKIRRKYDRVSKIYDFLERPMEILQPEEWRKNIVQELTGNVLEVGIGTGKNIKHYPDRVDVIGIDFSYKMLVKANKKMKMLNKPVKLIQMDVENLEFEDNTFDTVFATWVFCSVPNPVIGLEEIKRVCKNNGKIILLEHMRSGNKMVARLMDFFNPLVASTCGANINRDTLRNIENTGFNNYHAVNLWSDIVKKIVIVNMK